jgi:two-component system cell cycle response regulator/two-component system cell cycle response regulator DivK
MATGAPILIVDDNPSNTKLLAFLLTTKGYVVRTAANADETLAVLREFEPRLILMDIQLPGMDGITALKQLRAASQTKGIRVIAITASAMTHNRQTMLAEGFDGYQTKPIALKDFLGEVERVLAARSLSEE